MDSKSKIKGLFLDRDGVINDDKEYLYKIKNFQFLPDIFNLCNYFLDNNFKIFIITNQAGVARGYFTIEDLETLNNWMLDKFDEKGVKISKIYYDPTHPNGTIDEYSKKSYNRKPSPGMIFQAEKDFFIDLSKSVLIGDKDSDILCGLNAKVKTIYKLYSDKYLEQESIYNKVYKKSSITRVTNLDNLIKLEKIRNENN